MSATPLAGVRMLVMDVDGVLTDGLLYYSAEGEALKAFHVRDGAAITFLHKAGLTSAVITGRSAQATVKRLTELGVHHVFTGTADKLAALRELAHDTGIPPAETAYIGDDLHDLAPMRACAISFAPADAAPEVRAACTHPLAASGGRGAVREAVEMILKAHGTWDTVLATYCS
ncbi:MAG: HAD-IIIA family hydrolase [Planctomycetota bacterium]